MLKNSTDGPGDNPARGAVGFSEANDPEGGIANDCCNIVEGVGDGSEADPPQGGDGGRDEKRKGGGEGVSGEWLDLTT